MPPKKKDDKKKDAGKDDAKKAEEEEERELVEKELVIGYLRSKLNRYQDHGDRLQVDVVRLTDELETQKLNLRDINEFLTNELKARSLTTSALEAKVAELNGLMEEVKKNHEAALSRLRGDKDREIERLEGVMREHERKARITQEFLDKKDALEAEMQSLKETLARKTKDFEQQLTDIDRQHIQDREKWKREMAGRIKETKLQMMKLTDNQLEMTTKRTIMENEQMSIELSYQSRQTEKLLNKNNKLTEENAELRRQLELSKQTEEELARRNNLYQKTIKTLLSKLQDQGYQAAESEEVLGALDSRMSDLAAHLHLAQLQLEEKTAEAEQLRERLESKTAEAAALTSGYDDTARFLLACMADVRDKVVTVVRTTTTTAAAADDSGGRLPPVAGAEGSSRAGSPTQPPGGAASSSVAAGGGGGGDITVLPGRLDELSAEQRERVLAWLLERLHVFSAQRGLGLGPLGLGGQGGGGGGAGAGDGGAGGRGGMEASASGVTLPPIPSFNRRQYATGLSHGPLSQSSPAPMSAGGMGASLAGEWGPGSPGGGMPGSRLGRLPTREQEGSAGGMGGPQGLGATSAASLSAGGLEAAASLGGLGYGLGYGGGVSSSLMAGMSPGPGVPGYSVSTGDVLPGGGMLGGAGVIGGGAGGGGLMLGGGGTGGSGAGGGAPVDEALAKVLSEVRPWGKRSEQQPLTTTKHSGTFLRKGNGPSNNTGSRGSLKV
ncbi:hypothetical protein HYH02_013505 [Chlamydomonas schloesseri]|uniref:Cilia- and flagella-associated protein 157 n=1 Tax=Chlamydomonas schloesseri TaxID=2026947 RepID=A0A835SPK2_9CHLO|nr:hypothetical protein HYH02_013505 [Chlamydomonas schloesseri]|eukprot:KAG2430972.1 hypothetical protein HYH02_013505 [Chlamydomonas schloesseri]